MRITLLAAALTIVTLIIPECEIMKPMQSSFFTKFSLHELVRKNTTRAGQICSSGVVGGGGGGAGFIGAEGSRSHKSDSFGCRVKPDDGERFDESELVESLREVVEKEIQASGAKILGRGNHSGGFYFEYGIGDMQGRIDISGKRIRENYYQLEADLGETSKK
jgi:hypothetical protein